MISDVLLKIVGIFLIGIIAIIIVFALLTAIVLTFDSFRDHEYIKAWALTVAVLLLTLEIIATILKHFGL